MNNLKLKINPIFATPLIMTVLPNMDKLNQELKTLFESIESSNIRNSQPAPTTRINIFDSEMDLFEWEDDAVKNLKRILLPICEQTIQSLNGYNFELTSRFSTSVDSWFHITNDHGYISPHIHSNASWSAVYYVDDGLPDATYEDNGVIRFLDTRTGANMYLDAGNYGLKEPFNSGAFVVKPENGTFIMFPSYLSHEVAPFKGKGKRISIAMNFSFTKIK